MNIGIHSGFWIELLISMAYVGLLHTGDWAFIKRTAVEWLPTKLKARTKPPFEWPLVVSHGLIQKKVFSEHGPEGMPVFLIFYGFDVHVL